MHAQTCIMSQQMNLDGHQGRTDAQQDPESWKNVTHILVSHKSKETGHEKLCLPLLKFVHLQILMGLNNKIDIAFQYFMQ